MECKLTRDNILYSFPPPTNLQKNMDYATLSNLSKNSKLQKLVKNVKIKKKPSKSTKNVEKPIVKHNGKLKPDPTYVNVEHLVFGCYRPSPSPRKDGVSEPLSSDEIIDLSSVSELEAKSYSNSSFYVPSVTDNLQDLEKLIYDESLELDMSSNPTESQNNDTLNLQNNSQSSLIEGNSDSRVLNVSVNSKIPELLIKMPTSKTIANEEPFSHIKFNYLMQSPKALLSYSEFSISMEENNSSAHSIGKQSGYENKKEGFADNITGNDVTGREGISPVSNSNSVLKNENIVNPLPNGKVTNIQITENSFNLYNRVNDLSSDNLKNSNLDFSQSQDINGINLKLNTSQDYVNVSSSEKIRSFSDPINPFHMGNILFNQQKLEDVSKNEQIISTNKSKPCDTIEVGAYDSINGEIVPNNYEVELVDVEENISVNDIQPKMHKPPSHSSILAGPQATNQTFKSLNSQKIPLSKTSRLRAQSDSTNIPQHSETLDLKNRKIKYLSDPPKKCISTNRGSLESSGVRKISIRKDTVSSSNIKTDCSSKISVSKSSSITTIAAERKLSIKTNTIISKQNLGGSDALTKTKLKKSDIGIHPSVYRTDSSSSTTSAVSSRGARSKSLVETNLSALNKSTVNTESNSKPVSGQARMSLRNSTNEKTLASKDKPKILPKPTGLQSSKTLKDPQTKLPAKTYVESAYLRQKKNEVTVSKQIKSQKKETKPIEKNLLKPVLPPKPPLISGKLTILAPVIKKTSNRTGVPVAKSSSLPLKKPNEVAKAPIQNKKSLGSSALSVGSVQRMKTNQISQGRRPSMSSQSSQSLSRQSSIASVKSIGTNEYNLPHHITPEVIEDVKSEGNSSGLQSVQAVILSHIPDTANENTEKLKEISENSILLPPLEVLDELYQNSFSPCDDGVEIQMNNKEILLKNDVDNLNVYVKKQSPKIDLLNSCKSLVDDVISKIIAENIIPEDILVIEPQNQDTEEPVVENMKIPDGQLNNTEMLDHHLENSFYKTSFSATFPLCSESKEIKMDSKTVYNSDKLTGSTSKDENIGIAENITVFQEPFVAPGVQGKPPTGKSTINHSPSFKRSVATVSLYRKESSGKDEHVKQLDLDDFDSAFLIEAFGNRKKSASLPRSFLSENGAIPNYKLATVYRGIWPNRLQPPTAMERLYPGGIPRGPILSSLFMNKQDNIADIGNTHKTSFNKKLSNASIEVHINQEIMTTNVKGSLSKTSINNGELQADDKEPQENEIQERHVTHFVSSTPSSSTVPAFSSQETNFSPVIETVTISSTNSQSVNNIPSLIPPTADLSEFELDLSPQEIEVVDSNLETTSQIKTLIEENMPPNRIRFEGVDVVCADNVVPAVPRKLNMSRTERWKRALSSPILRSFPNLQTGAEQRRPWSEVFTEKDANKILESKFSRQRPSSCRTPSCNDIDMTNTRSLDRDLKYFSKFASLDGDQQSLCSVDASNFSTPRSNIHDGFFQRFRKSFSMKFARSKNRESNNSQSSSPKENSSDHELRSDLSTISEHKLKGKHRQYHNNNSQSEIVKAPRPNGIEKELERSISPESNSDNEILTRFGSLILRASKHKKKSSKDKKEKVVKSYSADSGIQIEVLRNISADTFVRHSVFRRSDSSVPPPQTSNSVVLRQKAYLHERPRPISDLGGLSLVQQANRSSPSDSDGLSMQQSLTDLASGDSLEGSPGSILPLPNQGPPAVSSRPDLRIPRVKKCTVLRRSHSHPISMDKIGGHPPAFTTGPSSFISNESTVSSEDESDDIYSNRLQLTTHSVGGTPLSQSVNELNEIDPPIYAEALWDHVSLDHEELPFKIGDVIEVTDRTNKEWWWGSYGDREGWFPALFVRPRVNQEETVEDCVAKMKEGKMISKNMKDMNVSLLSNDQVRTNVINEIISTERNFVQHLKDVIEGYLHECKQRPDMFPDDCISIIFGNIEQIHEFQSKFLADLEKCINWEYPHLSEVGQCFLNHRQGFEIYSEYCNNHPQACSELQDLYKNAKYRHFFEACRLLQEMIDISLDGFLLTPVQKICKYPLQLAELLKYTRPDHQDYVDVGEALCAMRCVAQLINERKRRIECLEKLVLWQKSVDDWEGPDLLETSSELIFSGDVHKVSNTWPREFTFFLFDHQLIYCKKDLLKRNAYTYKGRIDMDNCDIIPIEDGKDVEFNMSVKYAWKIHNIDKGKWYLVYVKSMEEKQSWMKAFLEERRRVIEDKDNGFCIPDSARKAAMATSNKIKPKKPKGKNSERRVPWKHLQPPGEITPENAIRRSPHLSPGVAHQESLGSYKKRAWSLFGNKKHKR